MRVGSAVLKHASLIIDAPKKQFVFVPHNGQEITVSNSEAGSVSFIPSESGDTLGVLKAVIRKVSAAYQKGIRTGDYLIEVNGENWVSIHAPHAGSDILIGNIILQFKGFNPRPPCGERRNKDVNVS